MWYWISELFRSECTRQRMNRFIGKHYITTLHNQTSINQEEQDWEQPQYHQSGMHCVSCVSQNLGHGLNLTPSLLLTTTMHACRSWTTRMYIQAKRRQWACLWYLCSLVAFVSVYFQIRHLCTSNTTVSCDLAWTMKQQCHRSMSVASALSRSNYYFLIPPSIWNVRFDTLTSNVFMIQVALDDSVSKKRSQHGYISWKLARTWWGQHEINNIKFSIHSGTYEDAIMVP